MTEKDNKSPKMVKASIRGLEVNYVPHASFTGIAKEIFSSETNVSIQTLYDVVKHSPEVSASMLAKIEDVMADYWRFYHKSRNAKTEKSAINKAKEFEVKSNYYMRLTDALFDYFVTGNGYILKLSVDADAVKSIMEKITHKMAKALGVEVKKGDVFKQLIQDLEIPKDLQVLKASTVKINYDKTGEIISYTQEVRGEKRVYKPQDIIHLGAVRIGGQPYAFSRLEPCLSDVATLIFAKEFAGKYFENDGIPYFIFKMLEESPDGRNYKLLKSELKELKKKSEKYRSMVLTGNVEVDQVNKFNKDMEFAKLIEHFTAKIFMGLGVPPTRVHYTMNMQDAAQNIGKIETGYYKGLAFNQKIIENIINKDLWSLFDVRMEFKRSYKIDEMREAEITRILAEVGAITIEEARERIGMDPKIPKGTMPKSIGSDKNIDMARDKKREQGIDQDEKNKTDNKFKKKSLDALEVSFINFKDIVEHLLGEGQFTKAKVLYIESDQEFILFFSDGNWKYKTKVPKGALPENFRIDLTSFVKISP